MRSLTPHRLLLLAIAFSPRIWVAEARGRGGSGGSNGDSGDSDGDGGSGSGEGSTPCIDSGLPTITDLDVTRFDNYSSDPNYGGAYFFGEASIKTRVEQGDKDTCTPTVGVTLPNRLLAAAFIAPQSPQPVGPKNDIVIGLKGWVTDKSLEDFMTSYDNCNTSADAIFFRTTSWFSYTYPNNEMHGARDSVPLTLSAGDGSTVFKGKYSGGPQTTWSNISLAQWTEDDISFSDHLCNGYIGLDESIPVGTVINGSVSSDTLSLTVTGVVNSVISGVNVSFTVDFKGAFSSTNSTQAVKIGENGESDVSFAVINSDGSNDSQGRLSAFLPMTVSFLIIAVRLGCEYL